MLGDVLQAAHRAERLTDLVLAPAGKALLRRVIEENRSRGHVARFGVRPRRKLLFHGPTDCGKALAAAVLAGELGVPLATVRLDVMFSWFAGGSATTLRAALAEVRHRAGGVYVLEECDAVTRVRGTTQEVGELNRMLVAFLEVVDADESGSILIATTEHAEALDRAVAQRFELRVAFGLPGADEIEALLRLRLGGFELPAELPGEMAKRLVGATFGDIARLTEEAIRSMALDGREHLTTADVEEAFAGVVAHQGRARARRARFRTS